MIDRRIVRSRETKTALYLYLARKAEALALDALAVVSRDGLLVAGTSRDPFDLETLAALAPALAGDEAVSSSFMGRALPNHEAVDSARFEVDGERFYIASIGGVPPRLGEVRDTMTRLLA